MSLGENPTCTWDATGQILQINLGKNSSLGVGSGLFIVPRVVKSWNGVSSFNARRSYQSSPGSYDVPGMLPGTGRQSDGPYVDGRRNAAGVRIAVTASQVSVPPR
jgi:hypothetical protein